jgi:Cu-Zn family superoxide dismutase
MKLVSPWVLALIVAVVLVARVGAQEVAEGKFISAQGKDVGTVHVEHYESYTLFLVKVHDLPPGVHGIHIHSVGTCTPPSFDSAGPHFNPTNSQHGAKNPKGPHAGDLPNITIPADGKLETQIVVTGSRQWQGESGLFDGDGVSLVIHANPDDYITDPSGNSGPRIACAVLTIPQYNM